MMNLNKLTAISSIDGRYNHISQELSSYLSEYALIKYRILIEIEWFKSLSKVKGIKELPTLNKKDVNFLDSIYHDFSIHEAKKVKVIEKRTNHDVKAVEYYLRDKFNTNSKLRKRTEFIHFACTSEDINNLAYSLMIKATCTKVLLPKIKEINILIKRKSHSYSKIPMLSRTHGQAASPTTIGKELANFSYRINMILKNISGNNLKGKFNGAVGNFNAHKAAYPELEWPKITNNFIEKLGLKVSEYSTQIEDKDSLAELMSSYVRLNNILIDFSRDCWGYISLGYFSQKLKKGEVGSSTMPHKVNPIDFENAEGNLGISNANFQHISNKVVISRWQRDLSDSTVLRNIGNCFALSLIAYESLLKGLIKLEINKVKIKLDLENCWELITEAIQTVMRKNNLPEGYELMKSFSRGKEINEKDIQNLIKGLDIPEIDKNTLLSLTPLKYIGLADILAKKI